MARSAGQFRPVRFSSNSEDDMTKKTINVEAGSVGFDFENGKASTFDIGKCSPEIVRRLALHGASQKIGDSYAEAGKLSDPAAYAEQTANETIAQLYAGDWRVKGSGDLRISDLAAALARLSGKAIEAVVETLSKATDEQKKELREKAPVAAMLAKIKAEKAIKRADKLAAASGSDEVFSF